MDKMDNLKEKWLNVDITLNIMHPLAKIMETTHILAIQWDDRRQI